MKLGTLLLRDAVIGLDQLEAALRAQVLYGGRLGTNLVELGLLSVDTLGLYLAKLRDAPVATAQMFEAANPTLVQQFGSDLADLYTAFPLGPFAGAAKSLAVAMADPGDGAAVTQLARQCGFAIVPHVAAEMRVLYYLEKFYGIQRSARFLREAREFTDRGHPDRRHSHAMPQAVARGVQFSPRRIGAARAASEPSPRISHSASCGAIDAAQSRNDIASAIIEYAAGRFGAAVVFMVRGRNAVGWRLYANSTGGSLDAVECLSLALGASSVLQAACDSGRPYRGGPQSAGRPIEKLLWQAIGTRDEPSEMLVVPIELEDEAVNLVYAHGIDSGPIVDEYASELIELGRRASNAYTRLMLETTGRNDAR